MTDSPLLPGQHAWRLVNGQLPLEFYKFFRDWVAYQRQAQGESAELSALESRVAALERSGGSATILGNESVVVLGTLAGGVVQLRLEGDESAPAASMYYGTDAGGIKGFHAVSDTVEAASGELTKTVDGDGVTTFGLADITPDAGGSLLLTQFDAKGRRTHEDAATTDDLAEGATNLYYTDERAQDAVGGILVDSADIDFTYDDGAPSITGVLTSAIHASLDLADTALQPGDDVSELTNDAGYLTDAPSDGDTYGRKDGAWEPVTAGGGGTVTSVDTGTGLTGGPITGTGTISLDAASIASLALADTALQPGDNVSELVNDAGYLESVQPGTNVTIDTTDPLNPIINATGGGGGGTWGSITGTLSDQTDLQTALDDKADVSSLGTMAYQNANAVAITGGAIDGTTIGATTRAAGSFTDLVTTNNATIRGITVGYTGSSNTATVVGNGAGAALTTGADHTLVGLNAGAALTTQGNNTLVGWNAGATSVNANNTCFGSQAGRYLGSSNNVTAIGAVAAAGNGSTYSGGVFIGTQAGSNTATANQAGCVLIGESAGRNATMAMQGTVAIGNGVGLNMGTSSTAQDCVLIGQKAAALKTAGNQNICIGRDAASAAVASTGLTVVGHQALQAGGAGGNNFTVAIGRIALQANTSGATITAVGGGAGRLATGGGNCVYLGFDAGVSVTTANANITGGNNTFIGTQSGPASPTQVSGATALGYQAVVGTNNTVVLGRTTDNTVIGATSDDGSGSKLQVTGAIKSTTEYRVGSNKVVGARDTGWTTPTGTATKGTGATYTAPTISNPPTQAEVQAMADALQLATRQIKALTDMCIAHGLIGA